jgi:hypothetical protein
MSEKPEPVGADPRPGRSSLRAGCERSVRLCRVAPAFGASADFAIDKRAGQACPNLSLRLRCAIHDRLRQEGFPGRVAFDRFDAVLGGADVAGSLFVDQLQLEASVGDLATRVPAWLTRPAHRATVRP